MSLTIAAGDILNVRLNYSSSVVIGVAYNVLHYRVGTSTGTPPSIDTALAEVGHQIFNHFATPWALQASQDIRMDGVTVTDVFPLPRSVATTYTPGSPQVGGKAGDALPLQDAPTLLKRTAVGQRWGLGRLFYVGLAESSQHDGLVDLAAQPDLAAMALLLRDTLTITVGGWSATINPVLISGPENNPTRITPITGGALSNAIIKSQKRRRPGKGV